MVWQRRSTSSLCAFTFFFFIFKFSNQVRDSVERENGGCVVGLGDGVCVRESFLRQISVSMKAETCRRHFGGCCLMQLETDVNLSGL